jgi:hypothetical protein
MLWLRRRTPREASDPLSSILSRTPVMEPQVYEGIVARLAAQGYETKRPARTAQPATPARSDD